MMINVERGVLSSLSCQKLWDQCTVKSSPQQVSQVYHRCYRLTLYQKANRRTLNGSYYRRAKSYLTPQASSSMQTEDDCSQTTQPGQSSLKRKGNKRNDYLPPGSRSLSSVCSVYNSVSASSGLTDWHSRVQVWPKHDVWVLPTCCRASAQAHKHNATKVWIHPAANTNMHAHSRDMHMHAHIKVTHTQLWLIYIFFLFF